MKANFKFIRERYSDYTQTETANKLGMTLGNYQKYEYGKVKSYSHKVIQQFCEIFNCTPNDLFTFDNINDSNVA